MNAFVLYLPNRPGEMARVTEALAARGINILMYDLGLVLGVVVSDEEATRSTFHNLGVAVREVSVVTVRMEDSPGQAADISRRLADAGVNIEIWLPVDTSPQSFIVALGVDDIEPRERQSESRSPSGATGNPVAAPTAAGSGRVARLAGTSSTLLISFS